MSGKENRESYTMDSPSYAMMSIRVSISVDITVFFRALREENDRTSNNGFELLNCKSSSVMVKLHGGSVTRSGEDRLPKSLRVDPSI